MGLEGNLSLLSQWVENYRLDAIYSIQSRAEWIKVEGHFLKANVI